MKNKICAVYSFLHAARGNWRNAVYIGCGKCVYGKEYPCSGFLFIPGADGTPVVLPAGIISRMTGMAVDKDECIAVTDREKFETLYALWLEWRTDSPQECALSQIVSQHPCCYNNKVNMCCPIKYIENEC